MFSSWGFGLGPRVLDSHASPDKKGFKHVGFLSLRRDLGPDSSP